ncbi:helix-turn-helix domain-containing protein [Lentibacillus sp. CBA3610]|nr:helix-turn-helix domain-containing protein [Lentibacillus sp. CBA3610]
MNEKKLSTRKLSELSGIHSSTISRIIRGKRNANLHHLSKFAENLDVPITTLLNTEGYTRSTEQQEETRVNVSEDRIKKMLEAFNMSQYNFSRLRIDEHLKAYETYCETDEGQQSIHRDFNMKLSTIGSIGPYVDQLKEIYNRYVLKKGSIKELSIMGIALLYFIITVDVIPDYVLPVGFLDDAFVVQSVLQSIPGKK